MRAKLTVVVIACVAAFATPAGAATKAGCGPAVLKDWSDGKLDRTYSIGCYQAALNRMPEDMRSYTTAPDDIQRALLARLRAARIHHHPAPSQAARTAQSKAKETAQPSQRGFDREALSAAGVKAAGARRLPLPLLALAGIGLLLLTVGWVGVLARKLRS